MLFGEKLKNDVYPPWKDSYIDYDHLKSLLKEDDTDLKVDKTWSNDDENRFVEALDHELEKVYTFQKNQYDKLMEKLNKLEIKTSTENDIKNLDFNNFERILEKILSESKELESFSRLNYTGFIKIVKKHDKLYPQFQSVKSLLKVRLNELPFHSEGYSPLIYQISYLYNILRCNNPNSNLKSESLINGSKLSSVAKSNSLDLNFKSYKFWIHNDNLMEVKTRILRHLPILVYAATPNEKNNNLSTTVTNTSSIDSNENNSNPLVNRSMFDPIITSLYFDNEHFNLYNDKLLKTYGAPTLRIRWNNKLIDNNEVFLEKRILFEGKNDDNSNNDTTDDGNTDFQEVRIKIEPKYLNGFIFNHNDNKFKNDVLQKFRESSAMDVTIEKFLNDYENIKKFILQESLQPILRTLFQRTAFQIPGDDRIRITIDSNIIYIKEDSFDKNRPIRDPKEWHRKDIDYSNINDPLKLLRANEYIKFPYSVMEIKIKNLNQSNYNLPTMDSRLSNAKLPRKHGQWISELTNSHLVKEVPKFSKFIQGIASLYGDDDTLDTLPYWLTELESDIKIHPNDAYKEEETKLKKQKEMQKRLDNMRRLSTVSNNNNNNDFKLLKNQQQHNNNINSIPEADLEDHDSSEDDENNISRNNYKKKQSNKKNIKRIEPTFLNILTGIDSKLTGVDSEEEEIELPPGVIEPTSYIKNAGPIKVEAKVWLANERTFNRWLRVCTLLSILTFSIHSSVKKAEFPKLANTLAYIYFALTIFCCGWSYKVYLKRLSIIRERSGEHLDAPLGPIIVAVVLLLSLIVNFVVSFREAAKKQLASHGGTPGGFNANMLAMATIPEKLQPIQNFVFRLVGATKSS